MLDINLIRSDPELIKQGIQKKRMKMDLDELLDLDKDLRKLRSEVENLRSERNRLSKDIPKAQGSEREELVNQVRGVKENLAALEPNLRTKEDNFERLMLSVPNPPLPEVPDGESDDDNVEIRRFKEPTKFDFPPRDHLELAEALDIVDMPRASKFSGARMYVLKNEGAMLEFALFKFALDTLTDRGFAPMIVPQLVRREAMIGTGFFPLGEEDTFFVEKDDLYLIGTAEVSLVSYHMDEILHHSELPKRYCGYSTCFRREAGSYGRDTRGFYRLHQFNKVEQVTICANDPEISREEHFRLLSNAESIMQALGLPYRVALACGAEIGQGQVLKHEIETWMPSRDKYSETHSCSTLHEFQSRRLKIRWRGKDNKTQFCHTLNNTAIASPRILIPILENFQNEDGSVSIPEVLRPLMKGMERIEPKKSFR
ncbi:MAG: seryl-tRNA synthetase [Thermodesulfobacteriota bacterium]|nr:seryl-tRNA synthetase [Thermodesulfobacteriota bacterium]